MNARLRLFLSIIGLWLLSGQSWAECEAQSGFERGLVGESPGQQCDQRDYHMAFALGRQIHGLRLEQAELSAADAPEQVARLRVIDRELSQLEGLARVQGLLAADP
ncbi:MAG: hypothetical protein ACXIUM_04425 [Wenzhouxiangella sp.]